MSVAEDAYFPPPLLLDPVDDGEDQVILVFELVVERATGVASLACDIFENQVAVAISGKTASGGF